MIDDKLDHSDQPPEEGLGTGLKVLAFCIPLAGAIMYFIYKSDSPLKAKDACNMALIGFGVGVVLNVLTRVLGMA